MLSHQLFDLDFAEQEDVDKNELICSCPKQNTRILCVNAFRNLSQRMISEDFMRMFQATFDDPCSIWYLKKELERSDEAFSEYYMIRGLEIKYRD